MTHIASGGAWNYGNANASRDNCHTLWIRLQVPPDLDDASHDDPEYDPDLLNNVPDEFKHYTLENVVHNRFEHEHFRQFLADNYASLDLICWIDMEAFR